MAGMRLVLVQGIYPFASGVSPAAGHGYLLDSLKLIVRIISVRLQDTPEGCEQFLCNLALTAAQVVMEHDISRQDIPDDPHITLPGLLVVHYWNRTFIGLKIFSSQYPFFQQPV